ncbi:alpha/beta fold hydrolase [Acinetobacter bouvetii]|uniref:2-succinyl-6-hydroxy-2, 4-cyclohexadiene-1-carboxylate synthase n=1 Tax=Acinetobacter bouvetii TaxID=202951 RepID=A0A811GFU7_9GAMM|nr:alpha/beta hydrolase [Acinetobacter bouvetii]CAB1221372.1 2-succinyl-6-hydroxy-2, 4-cyclohexadiene-1-carboxylate synthase [Acinetobacter bouvetii]
MPHYQMPDREQLFVRQFGQGKPVLVLSGLGMQSWQWLPFLYQHSKNHQFIIPDWRGFGGSQACAIPELDAISSHWRDIESLIAQLQLNQFSVIAYSMGATTAMHGMQYGHLQQKLTHYLHIDQTPKITVDDTWQYGLFSQQQPQFKQLLAEISQLLASQSQAQSLLDLESANRQQLLELWLEFIQLQASNKVAPLLFKMALKQPRLQSMILPIQRLDYLAWYVNNYLYHNEDYRESVARLACPSTFFIGQESRLYPAAGQKLIASSVQNSKQIIFEKSGHTPLLTEPLKFAREISAFLKSNATHKP